MAKLSLKLPTIQNWNCHNCSGCCHQHLIEITDEERERIEGQKWEKSGEIPADQELVVKQGWGRGYRLTHQESGACVFLNEQGLCRIHAKFGEAAKPLACRIYPYAFHPSGSRVAVSLRYSCPSVVENLGQPLTQQLDELTRTGNLVVPDEYRQADPPAVSKQEKVDWPNLLKLVSALDEIWQSNLTIPERLAQAVSWLNLIGQSSFEKLTGGRLDEFLNLILEATQTEVLAGMDTTPPTRTGKMLFRVTVAQYARKDTVSQLGSGFKNRWRLLKAAWRFSRGTGNLPVLQECFRSVPFEALETSFGEMPEQADELLTRYLRVKTQGLHFCGAAYYGVPFVEGANSLILMIPIILWIARWLAAGDSRNQVSIADLRKAMTIADHHYGYSPALGFANARRRVRMMTELGDLPRLILHYSS